MSYGDFSKYRQQKCVYRGNCLRYNEKYSNYRENRKFLNEKN